MPDERILPAHIEETVQAIARLHTSHRLEAGPVQRAVDRSTAWLGRPFAVAVLAFMIFFWIIGNVLSLSMGAKPWDMPPFNWLQGFIGLMALFVTLLILTTQRRDDELASYREQLTLELAILAEQKAAKIISLLEEMRRDDPALRTRVDEEAAAMSIPADPQAVLDAIKESVDFGKTDADSVLKSGEDHG